MAERILIVGPSWVGDMVMAQSLFIALKQRFPDAIVDVLAPEWSRPIIARMPEVHETISMPVGHGQFDFKSRYNIGVSLRTRHYTRAIILPRSFKSALVPWIAKIPVRTGYRGEMRYGLINDMRVLDKTLLTQTVQRYVALGLPAEAKSVPVFEYPALAVDQGKQTAAIKHLKLSLDQPVVAFMPGAEYGPAKCWPTEYFAELAKLLAEDNKQVWVFGSAKEVALGAQIEHASPDNVKNLCGRTKLEEVVDLLACTKQVVTNDSGLMHVACAVDAKVYAIYGSSSAGYTPPLNDSAEVIENNMPCSPCFQRTCRYGHYDCLRKITAKMLHDVLHG
jgi:heptosyltransferase-2